MIDKKFRSVAQQTAITFDSESSNIDISTEEIYQQQSNWDTFSNVCHEGNGIMKISGK
jgi:hypothetical protein